jgi:hypothetical protein
MQSIIGYVIDASRLLLKLLFEPYLCFKCLNLTEKHENIGDLPPKTKTKF